MHDERVGTFVFTQRNTDTDGLPPLPAPPKPRDSALLAKAM